MKIGLFVSGRYENDASRKEVSQWKKNPLVESRLHKVRHHRLKMHFLAFVNNKIHNHATKFCSPFLFEKYMLLFFETVYHKYVFLCLLNYKTHSEY